MLERRQIYLLKISSCEYFPVLFGLSLRFLFDGNPGLNALKDFADFEKNPPFFSVESFLFLFYLLEYFCIILTVS